MGCFLVDIKNVFRIKRRQILEINCKLDYNCYGIWGFNKISAIWSTRLEEDLSTDPILATFFQHNQRILTYA